MYIFFLVGHYAPPATSYLCKIKSYPAHTQQTFCLLILRGESEFEPKFGLVPIPDPLLYTASLIQVKR